MFTAAEVEALVLGMRVVSPAGAMPPSQRPPTPLSSVSRRLYPEKLKAQLNASRLFAPGFMVRHDVLERLRLLRLASDNRNRGLLRYRDPKAPRRSASCVPSASSSGARPGPLFAWCELRTAFRQFRLDRVIKLDILEGRFEHAGKLLSDFLAVVEDE